ncbi:MAG: 50S ribosomal protein L25 [Candidatus Dormiibacterota bacterium]
MQLIASPREAAAKASRKLRPLGKVPAVIYGQGRPAESVAIDAHELSRLLAHSGRTQLIDLVLEGARSPRKVLIKDVQMSPRRNEPVHVDFHAVSLRERVQVEVPIAIVGEAPAVRAGLGDVIAIEHVVTVECLPTHIPDSVEVDVSGLEEADQGVRLGELTLPQGVTIIGDPEETLVKVQPARVSAMGEEEEAEEGAEAPAEEDAEEEESE